jgi:outer membrane protein assembly factor BamB
MEPTKTHRLKKYSFSAHGMFLEFLVCLLALAAQSCQKEKDKQAPSVSISVPQGGSTLSIPDTLQVRASYSDDKIVEDLFIQLVGPDGTQAVPELRVSVDAANGAIDRTWIINDERLLSGTYRLVVSASDGTNTGSAEVQVQVQEAPLRTICLFASVQTGAEELTVYRIGEDLVAQPFGTFQQDASDVIVDSYNNLVLVAGGSTGPCLALDATTGAKRWSLSNPNVLELPYFTCVYPSETDRRIYVGDLNGIISGYSAQGSRVFNTTTIPGKRSEVCFSSGNALVSVQKEISSEERAVGVYDRYSGQLLGQQPCETRVEAVYGYSDGTLLFFGNDQNDLGTLEVRTAGGKFLGQASLGSELVSTVQESAQIYYLGFSSSIVRYSYTEGTQQTVFSGTGARRMGIDRARGWLLLAEENEATLVNISNGQVLTNIPFVGQVLSIRALYNR